MKRPRVVKVKSDPWLARPAGEVFPEVMTTIDVAMLLRYDGRNGATPEKGTRMVRLMVRDKRLPTLGRVGRALLINKTAVLAWLGGRGNGQKTENHRIAYPKLIT